MMRAAFIALLLTFAPAAQAQSLADLGWLVGCWRTAAPAEPEAGAQITEVWAAPPMPAMLGHSYASGEGELQSWEQTRIDMIDGWPSFVAMPNGGAPVRFRMVEPDATLPSELDGRATFSNPEHDYPQRLAYERRGDDLTTTISLASGADALTFHYHRIACSEAAHP